MHIKKTILLYEYTKDGYVYGDGFGYEYWVAYHGFVSSGPDLGACIAACHGAANQKSV